MPKWEINQDLKIRLNLSALALDIISQDRLTFGAKSRSDFLNRVFLNAYQSAEASIGQRLAQKEQEYAAILDTARIAAHYREAVVKQLLAHARASLIGRHTGYEKGHAPFNHTICAQVEAVLTSASVCREAEFYTIAQYFRAVIEEYCRLPVLQREAIYFRAYLEQIRQAIASQTQLEVCNFSGVRHLVHPYKLLTDPLSTAHYLVCYGRKDQQPISQKTPCSFRLANLKQVRNTGVPAFLSQADSKLLENMIRVQGVQFLVGQAKEIRVRLTPQGVRKLHRHSTLRPAYTAEAQEGIYTFHCTETQAEYYLLKLGADAEVLAPARLRGKFKRMHLQAAENYSKNAEE